MWKAVLSISVAALMATSVMAQDGFTAGRFADNRTGCGSEVCQVAVNSVLAPFGKLVFMQALDDAFGFPNGE